ncbi:MAG TPA: hypothetical protein VHA52_07705, partial [Candidatus Babeliaceae bacterium]|nr:hypothetical protein [Candidatus Babeliaceae bacterium]
MKIFKNYIVIFLLFISETISAQQSNNPFVLIPSSVETQVAILYIQPDNLVNYAALSIPYFTIIRNYLNASTKRDRILNPNLLGGLPSTFQGIVLTGISKVMDGSGPLTGSSIYVSLTFGGSHYILTAYEGPADLDYNVTSALVVSAPFAPASSGWTLSHIEESYSTSPPWQIFGLFTNGTSSYTASIDPTSGVATIYDSYPTTCYQALSD